MSLINRAFAYPDTYILYIYTYSVLRFVTCDFLEHLGTRVGRRSSLCGFRVEASAHWPKVLPQMIEDFGAVNGIGLARTFIIRTRS